MFDSEEITMELLCYAEPENLNRILVSEYIIPMPESIETIEDMQQASTTMGKIVGFLQFLMPCSTVLKIKTQDLKAQGEKEESRLMMQRRDTVDAIIEILKTQRETLSRMITIKQEINKEMTYI